MTKGITLISALFLGTSAFGADKGEITVKLTVPDSAWTLTIDEVYRLGKALWVISTVSRDPNVMGAQMISTLKASIELQTPELPLKHLVIGKTWNWKNKEPYSFIKNREQIEDKLKAGKLLYRRTAKNP